MNARESTVMRVAPEICVVALATLVSVALGACGSDEEKRASASAKDSGPDGTTGIFIPIPDAAHVTHLGDGAAAECGGFGRAAACTACLRTSCCSVATECARTSGCTENVQCIRACDGKRGDAGTACFQACADAYFAAAGVQYNDLVACMNTSCNTECRFSSP